MLTDTTIKAAPIPERGQRKLADADGLYLLLKLSAAKTPVRLWRLKFRIDGRESTLGLGPWPEVPIAIARERALEARRQIRAGQNPADLRRAERSQAATDAAQTFGRVGREYLQLDRTRSPRTQAKHEWLFRCLERLHGRPLSQITTRDIVTECRRYEAKGQHETAHRLAMFATGVFRYARQSGITDANPAADLKGALRPVERESFAAITDPAKFGALMRAVDSYESPPVRHALQLLALTAVRPGEVCGMTWAEVNFEAGEWLVPLKRTKMRKAHWVPLSRQAVAVLKAQREISGGTSYVFHQDRTDRRPMSDGTLGAALARLGYKPGAWDTIDGHHPHGFRSSFSTIMNAQDAKPEIIELCLSHGRQDRVAAIYNRHSYQAQRRELMQAWADLIDKLKQEGRQ